MSKGSGRSGSGGGEEHSPEDFANPTFYEDTTPREGSPATPGRLTPDKAFHMEFFNDKLEMPDGRDIEFWGFEDKLNPPPDGEDVIRPSSSMRVTEGDIVHVTLKPKKRQHTIHLHGIEADAHNDGVGHTSFEVNGEYTYQFRAGAPFRSLDSNVPQTRGAGTYFYHCHVNTTLHFHMGMYGGLFVDPIEGPGTAFHMGPQYNLIEERGWGAGDVDPAWRELGHAAGTKGGDAGLNDFNPVYFDLTGKFQPMKNGKFDPEGVIEDPLVTAVGDVGGLPIFIRYGNTSYTRQKITFHGIATGQLAVQVIAADGRPFDNKAPNYAKPMQLDRPIESITGERFDFMLSPLKKGTSIVTFEYFDWITKKLLGVARTTITGR